MEAPPLPIPSPTPPQRPIYNLHASDVDIALAVEKALPNCKFISATEFPRGSSFNNRIYNVRVQKSSSTSTPTKPTREQELIFKLSGRVFGSLKTLNEVMCLRLVERHCPELPFPEVLAWSTARSDGIDADWILMEKLPGENARTMKFEDSERQIMTEELAMILSTLRSKIPSPGCIGTVRDVTQAGQAVLADTVLNSDAEGAPWKTSLEYYRAFLESEIKILETIPIYQSNLHLIPMLKTFIALHLPKLALFQDSNASAIVFTHGDPADRNILITRSIEAGVRPLRISGVVDLEFAGFFPIFEDFITLADEYIAGILAVDFGESPTLRHLYSEMEDLGVATPDGPLLQPYWSTAVLLRKVMENTAPWYVRGKEPGDEVREQLSNAGRVLQGSLEELSKLATEAF